MFIRWVNDITDFIHRGYNNFVYKLTVSDTTGPTIVYGFAGR